ncbi:MAG: FtsX-like permease family protein [Ilumatobacter sp.]
MSATLWVARRHLRRRWASVLPFFAVIAAGSTGGLVAMNAAYQTDAAYSAYLERAEVGDLLVNPSIQTAQIDRMIRGLPGVTEVVSADLFYAAFGEFASTDEAQTIASAVITVFGSDDGRYVSIDRLAYRAGRAPMGTNEAVLSVEAADLTGLGLGDQIPLTFASIRDDISQIYLGEATSVGVIGVEHPTVVGIATFPDEVLPDGLYERGRIVVSGDIARRYACTPDELPPDATAEDVVYELAPAECSTSYRYWSLRVAGDDGAIQATLDALTSRFDERNGELAPAVQEMGLSYVPIVTTTADASERVDRTMRPTVVALTMMAIGAALVTIMVASLLLARALHRDGAVQSRWNELGLTTRQRTAIVGGPMAAAGCVGALLAIVVASLIQTGPVGAVEVLEHARAGLEGWAWWLAGAITTVVVVSAMAISLRVSSAPSDLERPVNPRSRRGAITWRGRPDVGIGVREALNVRRASMLTWVASMIAFAVLVAAVVFGASLNHLVASPSAFGWPWDLANLTGSGYGGVSADTVSEGLDGDPRIAGWTALGLTPGINVDGGAIAAVITYDSPSDSDVVVTAGRLPRAVDEIALGSRSAAERGIGVGEEVSIEGDGLRVDRARVTGIVVLPSIGPFQADAATPGRGVLLPDDAFDTEFVSTLVSFVGIDVADDVSVDALRADLDDKFWSWETYDRPRTLPDPVRPPEIMNARSIRTVPLLVGTLIALAIIVGYCAAMAFAARERRRDLALLRTLGFTDRQLRRSVRIQSVITAVITCGVGTVAGIPIGRAAWRLFAVELGVVPDPTVPPLVLLAVIGAAALLGLLAAILPSTYATRLRVATVLRAP